MKKLILLLLLAALPVHAQIAGTSRLTGSIGSGASAGTPVQQANIAYIGYFKVPAHGTSPGTGFDIDNWTFGGGGMWAGPTGAAPGTGTLYLSNSYGRIGVITIPAVASWNGTLSTVYNSQYLGPEFSNSLSGTNTGLITANTTDVPPTINFEGIGNVTSGSTTLTITSVTTGTIGNGTTNVTCPGLPYNTKITYAGGSGGTGTYTLSNAATKTVTGGTCKWTTTFPVIGGFIPRSDGNFDIFYYWYYPGGACCSKNIAVANSTLTDVLQPDQQLGSGYDPSQYVGMVGTIGSEWQSALGGSYLSGQGTLVANDARATIGPSAAVIDPNFTYGSGVSLTSTQLIQYPYSSGGSEEIVPGWAWHGTGTSNFISNMDRGASVFVPHGFSSMAVVGLHGVGPYCYGDPTNVPANQGVKDGSGITQCYDLGTSISGASDKGVHSYPYEYWMWLWNVSDLEAVKAGTKQPWQIYPYAAFQLPWPVSEGRTAGDAFTYSGAAYYDQSTGYIYMLCSGSAICVWQLSGSIGSPLEITAPHALPPATHGVSYSTTLTSIGGTAPITWHLLYTSPTYVPELSMTSGGVLSGTMAEIGTYDVMVEATDANGLDAMIGLSLTIN